MTDARVTAGSVMQIVDATSGREGWFGAFLLVSEVREWGVQGSVHHIETHATASAVWIRLSWDKVAYVGQSALMTTDAP